MRQEDTQKKKRAEAAVDRFVAENPRYAVDAFQPDYRGGTNVVTFGTRDGEPVVYKYFDPYNRWRNELYCLQALAPTGYVPETLAVKDHLIVMTRLSGAWFGGAELDAAGVRKVSDEIGRALGAVVMTSAPPASDGYSPADFTCILWDRELTVVFEKYISLCRKAQKALPAYQTRSFTESLDFVESRVPTLTAERPALFHEDIANMAVDGDRFVGFYDLEMCRMGPKAAQLGCALSLCSAADSHHYAMDWGVCLNGFEDATGQPLSEEDHRDILAMGLFYHHIRMCRYGWWDGDPTAERHMRAAANGAEGHFQDMRKKVSVVAGWTDLRRSFSSLAT